MNQNQIDRLYKKAISMPSVEEMKAGLTNAGGAISDAASTAGKAIYSGVDAAGNAVGKAYDATLTGISSLPKFNFETFKKIIDSRAVQGGAIAGGVGLAGAGVYKMMKKRKKEDE